MGFQQNLLEKAHFIAKMSGPTMVRPANSDFWKAPLDNGLSLSDHIFHVRKCFAQKAGALKRMKYLSVQTL